MHAENTDEFVDMIAQAVVDKMEAQARMDAIAEAVFRRVVALQQEKATASAGGTDQDRAQDRRGQETHNAGE